MGEADEVVVRSTQHATHKGEFQAIPATGKRVIYPHLHMATFVNGKFKESWVPEDDLGLVRQIGMDLKPA